MASSALEWLMGDAEAQRALREYSAKWHTEQMAWIGHCIRRHPEYYFNLRRRRPHTDDMMQMCVDLGIDVPDVPLGIDVITIDFVRAFKEVTMASKIGPRELALRAQREAEQKSTPKIKAPRPPKKPAVKRKG